MTVVNYVRDIMHKHRATEVLQVLRAFPFLGDNIIPDSKYTCPPQPLLHICFLLQVPSLFVFSTDYQVLLFLF